MTEKPAEEGRVASMVSALKQLLAAPLIFIVAVGILLPLSAGIGANALAFEWENTIALVLVLSGVILLVVIPLMGIYTYKENQRELSSARLTAIESEAERRNEQERNKQNRFNQLMDAKIDVLKAEKDYILDQSERHERRLLKETSESLAEQMTQGLEFAGKAEKFDLSVTEVVAKLEATDIKFDSVLESLAKISKGLETPTEQEQSPQDEAILSLSQLNASLIEQRDKLKSYVKVLEEKLTPVDTLKKEDQVSSPKGEIKSDSLIESGRQALKEALGVLENLEDDAPEECCGYDGKCCREGGLEDSAPESLDLSADDDLDLHISAPTEYDHVVKVELPEVRPLDPSPNYWICPKCSRPNILKRPRCQCGRSKPL